MLNRLHEIQPSSSKFWTDLNRLRTFLEAKETIHVVYVKLGFHCKRFLLQLGKRWLRGNQIEPSERKQPTVLLPPTMIFNSMYPVLLQRMNNEITHEAFIAHLCFV